MKRTKAALAVISIVQILSVSSALAASRPSQAYLELHKKQLTAKKYEDLLPLRTKESISHDRPMTKAEAKEMFGLFKEMVPRKVTVLKEEILGDNATVTVEVVAGKPKSAASMVEQTTGLIYLHKEDGEWKLNDEDWHSEVKTAGQYNGH